VEENTENLKLINTNEKKEAGLIATRRNKGSGFFEERHYNLSRVYGNAGVCLPFLCLEAHR
jgi:hypothetical protein